MTDNEALMKASIKEDQIKAARRQSALKKMRVYVDNLEEGDIFTSKALRSELGFDELQAIFYDKGIDVFIRGLIRDKKIEWDGECAMKL